MHIGDDYDLYYVVNEAAGDYEGTLTFHHVPGDAASVYRYDAWTGECASVEIDAENRMRVRLEPRKGYLYLFDRAGAPGELTAEPVGERRLPLTRWMRSACHAADYPRFGDEQPVALPDAYEAQAPEFGGLIRYRAEIWCDEAPASPVCLRITGAQEGIEVFVNGVSAGIQIVPEYRFRIGELLKQGVNRIAIEQATTLERVVSRVNSVSREPIVPTNHLGIDGTVELSGTGADIGRIHPALPGDR